MAADGGADDRQWQKCRVRSSHSKTNLTYLKYENIHEKGASVASATTVPRDVCVCVYEKLKSTSIISYIEI